MHVHSIQNELLLNVELNKESENQIFSNQTALFSMNCLFYGPTKYILDINTVFLPCTQYISYVKNSCVQIGSRLAGKFSNKNLFMGCVFLVDNFFVIKNNKKTKF